MGRTIYVDADEFSETIRAAGPSTSDDVSITMDGRRLDSKQAVLAWLAEPEEERPEANAPGRGDHQPT